MPRGWKRFTPFLELGKRGPRPGRGDLLAGLAIALLTVPQAAAYALIAGLPPIVGLYAASVPTLIGSLFRSSRHVITGPSNALSLLVGTALAAAPGRDPVETALTLSLMVGVLQLFAGVVRLGAVMDYVSQPVVLGYITGAAVLIVAGQLFHVTGGQPVHAPLPAQLVAWIESLPEANLNAVVAALSVVAVVLLIRKIDPRLPGLLFAMVAAVFVVAIMGADALGLVTVSALGKAHAGLPPLRLPSVEAMHTLWPSAVACAVLSLVESSSIGRAIASRSGQRIDRSADFTGQGLANIAASFFGGYPTSGSLSRSSVVHQLGGRTRLTGVFAGLFMLGILFFVRPVLDHTPTAVLGGLLFIIAFDLVDLKSIRTVLRARTADRTAMLSTFAATLLVPLDTAIYLGAAVSVVFFLRRARMLTVRPMGVDAVGKLREASTRSLSGDRSCPNIRILHVEGPLFFGSAGELRAALEQTLRESDTRVVILRLKRTQAMDATVAITLADMSQRLKERGKHLLIAGLRRRPMKMLQDTGVVGRLGEENVFPANAYWLGATEGAIARACALIGSHSCAQACPLEQYLDSLERTRAQSDANTNA